MMHQQSSLVTIFLFREIMYMEKHWSLIFCGGFRGVINSADGLQGALDLWQGNLASEEVDVGSHKFRSFGLTPTLWGLRMHCHQSGVPQENVCATRLI